MHNLGWIKCSSSSAYDSLIDYMLTHLPRELGTLRLALDKLNEVAVKQKNYQVKVNKAFFRRR